ncbi:Di-copper centre-containing protein [Pluteus cervinus]|uniref:Di-copper centre-containing protein n=1 Tax=Pluteus cervinus TaxID=181527 RepID=A0ACD3B3W8_9AGAR|nr:Di-copper centre-containing protein [Pluteus cervinus]
MRFATLLSVVLCATSLAAAFPSAGILARQDDDTSADTTADTSADTSADDGTVSDSSASSASVSTTSVSAIRPGCAPQAATRACTNPTVRKEWRTLSNAQKQSFLTAVKCYGTLPHSSSLVKTGSTPDIPPINPASSAYDDMVYVHIDLNHQIHSTGWFFPWHRFYLHTYEQTLKNKCGYTGPLPYWDWTQDTANFLNASIWDSNHNHGVGTWGTATNDYQITDGAWGTANPSPFYLNYPSHHAIRRNFTLQPYLNFPRPYLLTNSAQYANETFTQAMVDASVQHYTGDYKGFQKSFQDYQGPHAGVHLMVGADLTGLCPGNAPASCIPGETWSPNDPLFFMHHARVDKAWYDWQNRNAANKCAFEGGSVQMLDSLADYDEYPLGAPPNLSLNSVFPTDGILQSNVHIQDVMDTKGGYLCYTYQ